MFVSHDINHEKPKKKIQKPNILRRKTKVASNIACPAERESPITISLTTPMSSVVKRNVLETNIQKKFTENKPVHVLQLNSLIQNPEDNSLNISFERNEVEQNYQQLDIVNSYFIKEDGKQNVPLLENVVFSKGLETQDKPKWMEFINNTHKIIIGNVESIYMEQPSEVSGDTMVPVSNISMLNSSNINNLQSPDINVNIINVPRDNKFKCDINECKKEFLSEQKLKKHQSLHNKDGSIRQQRTSTIECPVKKTLVDGLEHQCGRIFSVREELAKHLNEEHTAEEAAYKCEECSRTFFWASGLRAHARSHAVRRRATLACAWPGCGRVFRQPCRLREHTRAHTGDKPYPCRHPNCGWSFRTASKLLRHARRHTGERRHACAVCGRAFLRREHLRDHTARHHAPHPRRAHACTVSDCEQSFTNMSSLYMHVKKVHKKEQNSTPISNDESPEHLPRTDTENMFMISLLDPGSVLDESSQLPVEVEPEVVLEVGGATEVEPEEAGHAARTHCTWPLARAHTFTEAADTHTHDAYVLGEDVHIEQSEGAESNIYTIRSDLFLHGNIIHNEDSEHMARVRGADADALAALDADLLLAAPSVDVAQEELYTDAADESPFRVFLLSGEELAVTE